MAWLGEGLSSLKGQITNFTKEVLSEVAEAKEDSCGHESQLHHAEEKIQQLESLCTAKDLEISKLREQNAALESQTSDLQLQTRKQQPVLYHGGSSPNLGGSFTFGDQGNVRREVTFDFSSMEAEKDDLVDYLRAEIRALKIEKEKVEKKMEVFQKKCSCSDMSAESVGKASAKDDVSPYGVMKSEMAYPNTQRTEPQYNSDRRLNVDDSMTCIRDVRDIEPEDEKILDARGECDGSEEIPKDVVKLMDQISKLTASLSDAQLNVNQLQENEKMFLREIDRMKNEEHVAKDSVTSLTLQLETSQKNNFLSEQKLEELDKQSTTTIEQLMAVVSTVKSENEGLQSELKGVERKAQALESELQSCLLNSKTMRREIELELEKEVLKFIPPELIPREPRNGGGGSEQSVVVGAVKGLAKALEEHRWKRDTLERKLSEMMKEAREVKAECLLLRGEISRRDNGGGLRTTEGLAPILETGEEDDDEEDANDDCLPKDTHLVAESKLNEKGDMCDGSEPNWQKRCLILEEEIKRLISERPAGPNVVDVCDEDEEDAEGTEEVDDWTWQAGNGKEIPEAQNMSLGNNIFVKDGEHAIMTISNDVEVVSPLQSGGEGSGPSKGDVPTLTEQYTREKSKLEGVIAELREEKSSVERTLEDSRESILKMEEKILALSMDLDIKTKSEMELLLKENELKVKVSEIETKVDSLETLLAAKNSTVLELETEVTSLKSNLLTESKCSCEMKQCAIDLKSQVSELETHLKSKDNSLSENKKIVRVLEEQQKIMEKNLMEEVRVKEELSKLVTSLEGKVTLLQTNLDLEGKLKDEALREAKEAKKRIEDLECSVISEVQLKDEALNKFANLEDRFRIMEQSMNQEMMSQDEFSGRIVEVERVLAAVKEEADLERRLKDEAITRVGMQEVQLKELNEEISTVRRNLQEKDQCIFDYLDKIKSLEMERERIMCVVGDKAREVSSLRSERQRLMEAMSSMEKLRQREMGSDPNVGLLVSSHVGSGRKDGPIEGTTTPPGEKERVDLDDDGTVQLLAKLKNLQLESEQLADSYRQEQQRNKHLQNEVLEMLEKETALQDELQRLRMHLVGVEDRYTKEAVNAEEHIALLKSKLTQVEERLHASSSAYTSASVRSNQQVESLENQIRALKEKRDESKSRLIAAEELLDQQAKDLTNLQSVLEQFQKDKDREISVVKDKMGVEISSLEKKCCDLSEEIESLKEQLLQAKEGLSAAARLSEQADKKSEIITSLKTELKKVNASLVSAEERLQNASLNVEGKVDRNLIKNLLLGYLSSPMQGSRRNEILRIIATILEFSQEEKVKADLMDGPGKGLGWLRGLSGWGGGAHSRDGSSPSDLSQPSLSEAFIRFLESESRPKSVPQLHMISETRAESAQSSSPVSGHSRTPSTSSTPPLLLSESILPTLPTFSVASGSNSSCILKDVLKDS